MSDQCSQSVGGTQEVFYSRTSSVPLPMMARAKGVWFWDEDGKAYIDASSGPMVSAIGHCNPRVIDAMMSQAHTLDYAYVLALVLEPVGGLPTGAVVPPPSY